MELQVQIRHDERKLSKIEALLSKEQLAKAELIQVNTTSEMAVIEKRRYEKNRPIPLVEKCILGLQDAMNDVGEFAREKYNMLVSFEASQKTRADFQASQLVMLQNELLAAEAEVASAQEESRLQETRQKATKQKIIEYYAKTQKLMNQKTDLESKYPKYQMKLNQITHFKLELQQESYERDQEIQDFEKHNCQLEQTIFRNNEQLNQLAQSLIDLESEYKSANALNHHDQTKIKEIRKVLDRELAEFVKLKSELCEEASKTTDQYEFEFRFEAMCDESLALIQSALHENAVFMEAVGYFKMYVPGQAIHLANVNEHILDVQLKHIMRRAQE